MKKMNLIGSLILALVAVVCSQAVADVYIPQDAKQATRIQTAEDAVEKIPGISRIPRSFLIGDGFKLKLSGTELRIDHMATASRAPVSRRVCMVSLNFISPVAFFGSSMELPLMTSGKVSHGWNTSSLGDYVLHFSKDADVKSPTLGLKITAHF
jgi:hypothetical protein